jgi:hypothetical protein
MKKRFIRLSFDKGRKLFLIMRITVFILMISLAHVYASAYSQNTKLNLDVKNASVQEMLEQIKQQSEYKFLFRSDLFDDLAPVNMKAKGVTIEKVLESVLVPQGISYEIQDNVVIFRKEPVLEKPATGRQNPKGLKGSVTDASGMPMPGVSVLVKGTTQGTITNDNGEFSLEVAAQSQTLVFSFVGMRTVEVAIGDKLHSLLKWKRKRLVSTRLWLLVMV